MSILEKDIELYLVSKVQELGGKAYKMVSPGNSGFPDRLVCLPGSRILLVELKRPHKAPRKLQLQQIRFLRSLGIEVLVIDRKELVDAFYRVMKKELDNDKPKE